MENKNERSYKEGVLSDCCKAKVFLDERSADRCDACGLLCYEDPETVEINVKDTMKLRDVPPGGK